MRMLFSKRASVFIIAAIYVVAAVVGYCVFIGLEAAVPGLWALFVADAAATVIVWAFGVVFSNVSFYDPYWSVAPPVMFSAWAAYKGIFSLPVVLLLAAVWYWGARLTGNWIYTFHDLSHEDWRYTRLRKTQSPLLFQLTNFFGLNMMPTVVVFAAMLPGFALYENGTNANIWTWLGFVMCLSAATIQLVADVQIHRFRNSNPGRYCDVGLWRRGRHPNYFGEILMWWGVWVMSLSQGSFDWSIAGPLAMTALFMFISIPMMERRQLENKQGYAEYRARTRILI